MANDAAEPDVRPVLAALNNPATRRVYAQIVLEQGDPGDDLSPSRRKSALETLLSAGLVADGEGRWTATDVFRGLLAAAPRRARPTGVERFLTPNGVIDRYPANAKERRDLLAHVAEQILPGGEVLTERELNERLERHSTDVATLRRYLVDHDLVRRSPDGSRYTAAPA